MSNPRLLTTELMRLPDGTISHVIIRTNGWRIDIDVPDGGEYADLLVSIANEAKDGLGAGWCACAYDGTVLDEDLKDLTLNGGERE